MKKFNLKKMVAYVLVAMLTLGVFSVNASAAATEGPSLTEAVVLAENKGYKLDADVKAELEAIVKDAADSLDIVEEGAQPEKSTFVTFKEPPVKVVKYDGAGHGLKAAAYKTVGLKYVADTTNLYVGITEDGTIYRSFNAPVEVGYYYAVCMYEGDANNYPSVAYGIVVILPACEEGTTEGAADETTEAPADDVTTEAPADDVTTEAAADETTEGAADVTTEAAADETTEGAADVTTEAPADGATDAVVSETEAPKTGDGSQIMLYAAVSVVALGAVAVILFKKRNA